MVHGLVDIMLVHKGLVVKGLIHESLVASYQPKKISLQPWHGNDDVAINYYLKGH